MLFEFIKISLRKIRNELSFSILSVAGLSLATVSCTIILMYVSYEKSYDNFRSADVYRVTYRGFENGIETGKSAQIVPALAPAIMADIPEIESAVRLAHTGPFMSDPVMQFDDKSFRESRIYFTEQGFLSMFSFNMLSGSAATALALPDQMALSETAAKKYFGQEDPMGKTLTFHRGALPSREIIVTGVFADVPENSHFHADFLISFPTLGLDLDYDWDWGNFYTYIKARPGTEGRIVESKIPAVLEKHVGKILSQMEANGQRVEFRLQPVQSIHLQSNLWGELEMNGDSRTVKFLSIIAILILLIAWINYINFSIARSSQNIKEISIRKISGSSRAQLVWQLLIDSATVNFLAVCFSIIVLQSILPVVKPLVGIPEAIGLNWSTGLTLIAIFVGGTLCSGLYPALHISRLQPVSVLKTRVSRSGANLTLNKTLIVLQFAASIILIIGTITIYQQLSFMREQELGLNIDQTLIVKGPAVKDSTYQSTLSWFGDEARKIDRVVSFAVSSSIPGEELHWGRSYSRKDEPQHSIGCSIVAVDEHFFTLFDATFAGGMNFPDGTPSWKDAIILNETAAKELGYGNVSLAVGETILWSENNQSLPKTVIGVVKDFNQQSLRKKVEPIVFTLKQYVFAPWAGEFYAFKVDSREIKTTLDEIENLWKQTFPENPFDFFFLDEYFNAQYKNDVQFGSVFTAFSILAIFIACLGLFGLTAYMMAIRTKEIGIRKVLGSSTFQLVQLLSANYLKLVLIAFVIACPLAVFLMDKWLSQFAYRISLSIWIFVVAGVFCFMTALITVGIKALQSANTDPVKALKYE
jgi:putative ABC transport system permease protein